MQDNDEGMHAVLADVRSGLEATHTRVKAHSPCAPDATHVQRPMT